jgi:hypothetical protein
LVNFEAAFFIEGISRMSNGNGKLCFVSPCLRVHQPERSLGATTLAFEGNIRPEVRLALPPAFKVNSPLLNQKKMM